jgi:hypothetical protein
VKSKLQKPLDYNQNMVISMPCGCDVLAIVGMDQPEKETNPGNIRLGVNVDRILYCPAHGGIES